MGLISRVSSRTYRESPTLKIIMSLRAQSQQHLNEHGGWVCKDRADFEKWWPELAAQQKHHTAAMLAHVPTHEQGKFAKANVLFDKVVIHGAFVSCLIYGFMKLAMEI